VSDEGLRDEIRKLIEERDQLRAELQTERDKHAAGAISIGRRGMYQTDLTAFHVGLSIDVLRAELEGDRYVEDMLDRMRDSIRRELDIRSHAIVGKDATTADEKTLLSSAYWWKHHGPS